MKQQRFVNMSIPAPHFLESWGDAEPVTGHISFIQPTISPLFKTRAFEDSLLKWSGDATDYTTYLKNYWSAKLGGETAWNKTLQAGCINSCRCKLILVQVLIVAW